MASELTSILNQANAREPGRVHFRLGLWWLEEVPMGGVSGPRHIWHPLVEIDEAFFPKILKEALTEANGDADKAFVLIKGALQAKARRM